MRVLFFFRHNGFIRNFEWMLRLLAEHGDRVELAFQFERGEGEIPRQLVADYGNVTISRAPVRRDFWTYVVYRLRHAIDYLRYLGPEYDRAPKLRARARKRARLLGLLTRLPLVRSRRVVGWLDRSLRAFERSVPQPKAIDRFLEERRPDVVLVTPLVDGPWQEDYVAAAKALGIPTGLAVASWDNLTNKGVIREPPDRTYVWNETQRREAIELHGLPPESVVAVGAHSYDHWFRWKPSTTRDEFCARVGLAADAPILLYLCSSGFVAEDLEPQIVAEWVEALRRSDDPVLREASVLVRPHFRATSPWRGDPLAGLHGLAVWPPAGADPRTPEAKAEYFDSLYHCAATVGVNTTALIEAAILGRPSFSFLHPKLRETQEGTLHFHYLTRSHGGPLETASSMDEHLAALGGALRNPPEPGWSREFVRDFIRPRGLDVDAAPLLVDEIAKLARMRPAAQPERGSVALRALLFPLALASNAGRGTALWARLFPKDVKDATQRAAEPPEWRVTGTRATGGRMARKTGVRSRARRLFYRVVHALLPYRVREPLRRMIRGPRPTPAELEEQKRAERAARPPKAKDKSRRDERVKTGR